MEIKLMSKDTAFENAVMLLLKIYVNDINGLINILMAYRNKDYDFIYKCLRILEESIIDYINKL